MGESKVNQTTFHMDSHENVELRKNRIQTNELETRIVSELSMVSLLNQG